MAKSLEQCKIQKKNFEKFKKGLYRLVDKEFDAATILDELGNKAKPLYEKGLVWSVDSLMRLARESRYGNKKAQEDLNGFYILLDDGLSEIAESVLEKYKTKY